MKFLKNLHAVSEFLFFIYGGFFLLSFMFIRNNFHAYEAELYVRLADIPFALVCILYGISSLKISFTHQMIHKQYEESSDVLEETPILDAILIIIGLVLFLIVVFLNFAFKDLI